MKLLNTAAVAALMLAAAACVPAENAKRPEAKAEVAAVVASDAVYPFKVGSLQAYALLDGDKAAGAAQRQAELASLAASGERVYFHHFPFPGIGRVQKAAEGYIWVPEG